MNITDVMSLPTPFMYNKNAFGGTEYMAREFEKQILKDMPKLNNYLSLIIPGITPPIEQLPNYSKEIILWMHNTFEQFDDDKKVVLNNPDFVKRIKFIVVPSEFHKSIILNDLNIDSKKVYVIENAIIPINYYSNKFKNVDQVKIIHTSSPERGLDVLLEVVERIDENFRLEIYNGFNPDLFPEFTFNDPRVKFYGRTPKKTVIEAVEYSHIHAYPSTYPETSCLSQIEAMAAGCLCVYSDLGALKETSHNFGNIVNLEETREEFITSFAQKLTEAIQQVRQGSWDPTDQIEYVNSAYSWEAIKKKWLEFHELL